MSMQGDKRAESVIPAERVSGILASEAGTGSFPAPPPRKWWRRWWWLGLLPVVLVLAIGLNEWRRNRQFQAAQHAFQEDRLKDAQEHIGNYLQARPDDAAAHLLAARIKRLTGSYAWAEKHLDQCKRLQGMTGELQLEWLLLRAMNGEFPAVEKDLGQLLADDHPHSGLIQETLAHCHIGVLRFNSALEYLKNWLQKEPDNVRALDLRAFVWERLENRERAMLDYARVLELAPGNRYARLSLIEGLLAEKNPQEAGEHLRVLRQNPENDPAELLALARFENLQGNMEQARHFLDDLLLKKPDHAEALHERGLLTEDPVQAEKYFRKALAANASYLQARFQLYNALFRQGRTKEAEAEKAKYTAHRKDLEKLPGLLVEADRLASPDLLADAAAILLRGNDSHQGTQLLFRALHLNPKHKRSHALLADYYEKTKQPEKAASERKLAGLKSP